MNPLEHPEAAALAQTLLRSLTTESDRGAILVGTGHVDNCFRSLFEAAFTSKLPKSRRDGLLQYPGPLASLAARNELAFAMRLIPAEVHDATNALRRIRNGVAHDPEHFSLTGSERQIHAMYAALGETLPSGLRWLAMESLLENKIAAILEKLKTTREEYRDLGIDLKLETKEEVLAFIAGNRDLTQSLEEQLPRWELAFGIAALCGLLIWFRELNRDTLIGAKLLCQFKPRSIPKLDAVP